MNVIEAIRRRVGGDAGPSHRCLVCGMHFDRRPLNCPACGTTAIEQN